MIYPPDILLKAKLIKLVIFDVDGVLTDGRLCFGPDGEEYKTFHVHDGLGVKLLQESGVEVAIISSGESPAVAARMRNLGVKYVYQGHEYKLQAFLELLANSRLQPQQIAYVGDDLPDLPVFKQVGLSICVPNACAILKRYADWQTPSAGGAGAAREVCELIMEAQGTLLTAFEKFSGNLVPQT